MENCLKVVKVVKKRNKIEIKCDISGLWYDLLDIKERFFSEYDLDIEKVPDSICVIPFICNILPIAWIFNLNILIDELDEEFYNCIEQVKLGYSNMYPSIPMQGKILVQKLIKNEYANKSSAVFFSGGVDAFNTLINHIDEKLDLLTIWGADISLHDIEGWNKVKHDNELVAAQWGLNYFSIKSNFRTCINYKDLSKYVYKVAKAEWWHDFQHGIAILGLAFPYAYINKYGTLYIASSFSVSMKGQYTCASDPTIDNYLKFANCKVVHDGYEYSRQDKIHNICEFNKKNKSEKNIKLRVCWESSGGKNCNECEKCWRTIFAIIAEKADPSDFGFNLSYEKISMIKNKLYSYTKYNYNRYASIQKRFLENYTLEETPKDLLWLRNIKIRVNKPKYLVICEKIANKFKNMIKC